MKRRTMREKTFTNEHGIKTIYKLEKGFYEVNGEEYDQEYYVSRDDIDKNGHCFGGYFRVYKRLGNALKDSYVEKYLEEMN